MKKAFQPKKPAAAGRPPAGASARPPAATPSHVPPAPGGMPGAPPQPGMPGAMPMMPRMPMPPEPEIVISAQTTGATGKLKADYSQLANIGLDTHNGIIHEGSLKELWGRSGRKAFREIADSSAAAGACLLAFEMLIRKVEWKVVPGDSSDEEAARAEAIESMRDDMSISWTDLITEILTMLVYGWSYMEVVYKKRVGPDENTGKFRSRYSDGLIGWRKFVLVPQESLDHWEFDDEQGLEGLWQRAEYDWQLRYIPIEKALLFRTKAQKSNPEGRSLLYGAFHPWKFAKRIMETEGIGIERDLAGMPFAGVPPELLAADASPEDAALLTAIKNIVVNVRRNKNEGVVFPLAYDEDGKLIYEFKLLSTGGTRQFDTGKVIERYERRITQAMLNDVIMMGHERVGSLALSRDKTTLLGRALASIIDSIATVFNRYLIPRTYEMNGWVGEKHCKFVPGDIENQDIKTLGVYVRNLMSVGALTPDPKLENELRNLAGLPELDPDYQMAPFDPANPMGGQADDQLVDENGDPLPPDQQPDPNADPNADPSLQQPSHSRRGQRRQRPGAATSSDPASSKPSAGRGAFPGLPRKDRPKKSMTEETKKSLEDEVGRMLTEFAATLSKSLDERFAKASSEKPAAPPVINNYVTTPEQPATVVNVANNMPEQAAQPAPVVNVSNNIPDQPTPVVTVHNSVPAQPTPVVNITVPPPSEMDVDKTIDRDPETGLVQRVRETHKRRKAA